MTRRINISRHELIIILVCVVFGLRQYNLIRTFFFSDGSSPINAASIAASSSFHDAPAGAATTSTDADAHHPTTPRDNNNSNTRGGVYNNNSSSSGSSPRQCTIEELGVITRQLPPDDCYEYATQPWTQRCSLSYATRCPDAVWLEQHYTAKQQQHRILQSSSSSSATSSTFLALFVGCNKGYDALNALRMGSANPTFDKSTWNTAMTYNSTITLHNDVCNEITNPQFDIILPLVGIVSSTNNNEIKNNENKEKERFVQVHCIEPMPATVKELQRAAVQTGYDKLGFIVTHAAMSANDGHVAFPRASTVGVENKGISNTDCKSSSSSDDCVNVTMYSLDSYIQTFIPNTTTTTNKEEEEEEEEIPINYLSIDVEGWDYEVLLGGKQNVLQRVHYLEFEYNWVGPWKKQSLLQVIEDLDNNVGFTCYWAGFNNTAWRITNCWLEHYESHFWSNIACVNRNIVDVQDIASDMEKIFMETLAKGDDAVRDYAHRFQRNSN